VNVSVSIGVTFYPQDFVNADQLIRHADQAMYVAKESGKGRYKIFDKEKRG
jgi:diguanylate cyclase (GGDEF)-like protein